MKQGLLYIFTLVILGLSMRLSGQNVGDYYTTDLILGTVLVSLGYLALLNKTEFQILGQFLRRKELQKEDLQRGLNILQNGWKYLIQVIPTFVLLNSINALIHAGDKQATQYLGIWLATVLLAGLYLLLLRWGFFLPLENGFKRRLIISIHVENSV